MSADYKLWSVLKEATLKFFKVAYNFVVIPCSWTRKGIGLSFSGLELKLQIICTVLSYFINLYSNVICNAHTQILRTVKAWFLSALRSGLLTFFSSLVIQESLINFAGERLRSKTDSHCESVFCFCLSASYPIVEFWLVAFAFLSDNYPHVLIGRLR